MSERWPLPDAETARREVIEQIGVDLADRLARVDLVVLDCDGILTSGRLIYGPDGEAFKEFDARDALGLMMLKAANVARAVLTGRTSAMVARRCGDLQFEAIKMGRFDKTEALAEIWRETGVAAERCLYMGDDLLDLPALTAAGVAVSVPGAPVEVRRICDYTTEAVGGMGAVREVCDLLLKARGAHADSIRTLVAGASPADHPEANH